MKVDFDAICETVIPHLNGGDGSVSAKMFMRPENKIMISRIPEGSSIGMHAHATSCEVDYVIGGTGTIVCDGIEELLNTGTCHYCPKGSSHSIVNTGSCDLVLFTVVPEQ